MTKRRNLWQIAVLTSVVSAAAGGAYIWFQKTPTAKAVDAGTRVVFALRDIPVGWVLSKEDVSSTIIPNSVGSTTVLENVNDAIGQVASAPIVKGQMLNWEKDTFGISGVFTPGSMKDLPVTVGVQHDDGTIEGYIEPKRQGN
jgi:Flp pilus assembly protein CpaB